VDGPYDRLFVPALRSALVIAVPEAGQMLEAWRERTCNDKPSIGIPAHVTILFPFVDPRDLDGELPRLGRLFADYRPFRFTLAELRRFPNVLYLAPTPFTPFAELIAAVLATYPDHPPYGGAVPRDSIVPHVTVASGDTAVLAEAEAEVSTCLPIASGASDVVVLEEVEPDWGQWRTRARLPLGKAALD
jgi:2'-5' RNA ligase